jgi:putative flippase GtrA
MHEGEAGDIPKARGYAGRSNWSHWLLSAPTSSLDQALVTGGLQGLLSVQLVRYFIFGSCAALLQLVLLFLAVEIFDVQKIFASCVTFVIAVGVNYFLQYHFTFSSSANHHEAFPKFFAIAILGLFLNWLIFSTLIAFVYYLIAQAIALLVIFMVNFILNRTLTFRT